MAQTRHPSGKNAKRLLGRAGLAGSPGMACACAVLVLVVALGAALHLSRSSGVFVERGSQQETAVESASGDVSTGDTAKGSEDMGQADESDNPSAAQQEATSVTIHIDGAVVSPGVYTLVTSPARTIDAVEAAGGLTTEANTGAINLAQTLEDGAKVHVPAWGEDYETSKGSESASSSTSTSTSSSSSSDRGSGGTININTATADELTTLPGVGPSTAQAIVEDRKQNGKFTSIEDLMRVSGIGEKKFAKMKASIRV